METKRYLNALEKVISKRYPDRFFNIGGYQESAICMQYESGRWVIYNGERGNRYNEMECDTVLKACLEFIRKMTHRVEDVSAMENELLLFLSDAA